jgi:hypothetical protein
MGIDFYVKLSRRVLFLRPDDDLYQILTSVGKGLRVKLVGTLLLQSTSNLMLVLPAKNNNEKTKGMVRSIMLEK